VRGTVGMASEGHGGAGVGAAARRGREGTAAVGEVAATVGRGSVGDGAATRARRR
jgi:hypothetical protein